MKKYTLYILVMFCSVGIASCQCKDKKKEIPMNEKTVFNYNLGMSAPGPYEMGVTVAFLEYLGDYSGYFSFSGRFVRGGLINNVNLMTSAETDMPDRLYVEWLSIVERKIYRADIDLRKNGIRDTMLKLFRQGYWSRSADPTASPKIIEAQRRAGGRQLTYNGIILTILPGGKLWMYMEGLGRRVFLGEVGQGKVVAFDSAIQQRIKDNLGFQTADDQYLYNIALDTPSVKHIAKYGIPYWIWDKYKERFRYNIEFEFAKPNTRIKDDEVDVRFINDERYESTQRVPVETKTRPTTIFTDWVVDDSIWFTGRFYFNEQELLDNFDKMYKKDRDAQGTLLIKVNKYSNSFFDIYLKVGNDSVKFEKTHIHIFKQSIDDVRSENAVLHFWNFRDEHLPAYIGKNIIDWDK